MNKGWRLDYFVLTQAFMPFVVDSSIHNEYHGSDHCPIQLKMDLTGKSFKGDITKFIENPTESVYVAKPDEATAA